MTRLHIAAGLLLGGLVVTTPSEAGQSAAAGSPAATKSSLDLPFAYDGPAPPIAPEIITRDADGRATVRAMRLSSPLRIDGQLDEAIYTSIPAMTGLIQVEPAAGTPASEKTEAWLTFDRDQVYVSFRCWDSEPDRIMANEMRRDNTNIFQNDFVAIILDTFYDRRNAVYFAVNAIGGRVDAQITNERQFNTDWNTVWDVKVGRFEHGWTAEAAIPFKSLRYRPGRAQIWGLNLERRLWRNNEFAFLTRIPVSFGWTRAFMQLSYAATIVGLEAPPGSMNLEIKPYLTSDLTSDATARPRISNDPGADVGVDVKYGLTQNLTGDFTYNTDFAQVEADEQQVNLTRFSLFFPEKRDFFLENLGTFAFGGAATSGAQAGASDTPILFYSRRIGLNQVQGGSRLTQVPIEAGGRLTGRVGRVSLGVLNIQADDVAASGVRATNFSVVRLKRDILRRSSVGVMYTGRSVGQSGGVRNDAYGVDGTFSFFTNLAINTYWAQTRTDGLTGNDTSHRLQVDYAADRYGVQVERLAIGDAFRPEVGFVRRGDMLRHFGLARFSPRPRSSKVVRKLYWTGSMAYIENGAGRLETRDRDADFAIDFHNSDRFEVAYGDTYEYLAQPFRIAPGVVLPVGGYDFAGVRTAFTSGQQRRISGNLSAEYGTFYNGHKTTVGISRGRLNVTSQLSIEPSFSVNWVDLVEGSFTTRLVGSRVTYTMTPHMFASALLQYNSGSNAMSSNVRLRWEYRPGSELFVVFNEERDTLARRFPTLANRALIFKINRLFRF
jgi:hypothetical protein